jgi:5-methylthioadenosine/S-adenosylhomocysteine deaminase
MDDAGSYAVGATMPSRDEFVVRGGYVVTMDAALGDIPRGDVHVRSGAIVEVGPGLDRPGVDIIDATDRVVMPGFVDTHFHLWNSLLRGVVGDGERAYFPVKNRLAPHFTPEDTYVSAMLALAEAVNGGITTVNDWDHNVRGPAYADANARAILDAGVRGRYSYGNPDKLDPGLLMDLDDVQRFARDWSGPASEGRISVGMAVRGPVRTDRDVCHREWAFAREHGLPMTMHCGGRRTETGRYCDIEEMAADGLLGPDLQVVHAVSATPREIDLLAASGCHVSLSPLTEYRSMGIPPLGDLLAAGILVSLSIDTLANPTTADMLLQVKSTLSVELARTGAPTISERRVLELATIDGARDLGLDDRIGSLTPGKRADLIAVRTDTLGTAPAADPLRVVATCATPADVDLVVADGRILKQGGRLTVLDPNRIVADARTSLDGLLSRAGWDIPLGVAADRPVPA